MYNNNNKRFIFFLLLVVDVVVVVHFIPWELWSPLTRKIADENLALYFAKGKQLIKKERLIDDYNDKQCQLFVRNEIKPNVNDKNIEKKENQWN